MTETTRATVLFWCQVGLCVTAMVLMLGILGLAWYFITAQIRTMEEDRARDRAMLQHHHSARVDHDRARDQHDAEWRATMQAFDAMLAKHRQ